MILKEHEKNGRFSGKPGEMVSEFDYIVDHTSDLWEKLRGKRIFITGGTGFFGKWILGSFVRANERFGLKAEVHILSRNPDAFKQREPFLASLGSIYFHSGRMVDFKFPEEKFHYIIHAASESEAVPNGLNPVPMLDSNIMGTRRVLEFARISGVKEFLYTSSGAVYGDRYDSRMDHVHEAYHGAPDPVSPGSAYGMGKRISEFLCRAYADQYDIHPKIARCFAFVGPYLPMTANYAIGNFIHDALKGNCIRINGDGTPCRSYLYAADLAVWLWTILLNGKVCYPYNVGSEKTISIGALAKEVAAIVNPGLEIKIAGKRISGNPIEYYVPSTKRAQQELNLEEGYSLHDMIQHTANWYDSFLRNKRQRT